MPFYDKPVELAKQFLSEGLIGPGFVLVKQVVEDVRYGNSLRAQKVARKDARSPRAPGTFSRANGVTAKPAAVTPDAPDANVAASARRAEAPASAPANPVVPPPSAPAAPPADGPIPVDAFAGEATLQDVLAKNLGRIELGLRCYEQADGRTGVNFPIGGQPADILAVAPGGDLVVIDVTESRAYDHVIGQLLRQMGWLEKYAATPGVKVRGMVVRAEIDDDLALACSRVNDVTLYQYRVSMSLKRVNETP